MEVWKEGEKRATRFLEERGCTVLDNNYRDRRGEIDIVARNEDTLIFVEVKTWSSIPFGELSFSLDERKRRKIVEESKRYIAEHPDKEGLFVRYDLVFVVPESGEIEYIRDAFTETGVA